MMGEGQTAAAAGAGENGEQLVDALVGHEAALLEHNRELAEALVALEVKRRRYEDLFESAPDGYLVTTLDGAVLEANRAAACLLGIRQNFLRGKPLALFIAPQDRRAFLLRLTEARGAQQIAEWEVTFHPRGGAQFLATVTVAAVQTTPGDHGELRWILRDISESKQAEEALRRSEARYRAVADLAGLISSTLDLRQVFDFIAEAATRLLDGAASLLVLPDEKEENLAIAASRGVGASGYGAPPSFPVRESIVGWVFHEERHVVVTDLLADPRTAIRAWVEAEGLRAFAGVPLMLEGRCLGVLCAMRRGGSRFETQEVELLGAFASHAAIAIRNARLFEQGEAEKDRLRAILDAMPQAVLVAEGDPQKRTIRRVMANRLCLELLPAAAEVPSARTEEFELARPDGSPFEDGDLPLRRAIWRAQAVRGQEITVRYRDGTQRSLLASVALVRESPGLRQAVAVFQDITERKRMEAELQHLAADNLALYNRASREAEVKGLLLDELNHRVRNSLETIVSFMELQREALGDGQAELALADAAARVRGLALVHNVLAAEGFQAGEYGSLVRGLAEHTLLQGPLAERVALEVEDGSLRLPPAHLSALGLISNELLTNIAKHAYPNGCRGKVRVTVEDAGPEVTIRVQDDGVGLRPAFGEKPGCLGLRLVRSLVEVSLRGSFALESGEGTTATIRFPSPNLFGPES